MAGIVPIHVAIDRRAKERRMSFLVTAQAGQLLEMKGKASSSFLKKRKILSVAADQMGPLCCP